MRAPANHATSARRPSSFPSSQTVGQSACTSISVRPRHGRINACSPVIKCARFSFVETCAVKRHRRNASAVNSVSGVAERKFPPSAKKTLALSVVHRLNRFDRVEAMISRRLKIKLRAELVQEMPPSAVPRCPSCDRPARCCDRAPDTSPRRAFPSARATTSGSRSPECLRLRSCAASGPWPNRRSCARIQQRSARPLRICSCDTPLCSTMSSH